MSADADEIQSLKDCKILLAEDEWFQARQVSVVLQTAGAKIVGPAGSVEDILKLMNEAAFDLAVVDINLGDGASFEIARNLRAKSIPFVFVTGYDESIIPQELSDAPRLEKPVDETQLIERLTSLAGFRCSVVPSSEQA
ncbi:MAG: response regulator [Sphingomonadaceae bacterium]